MRYVRAIVDSVVLLLISVVCIFLSAGLAVHHAFVEALRTLGLRSRPKPYEFPRNIVITGASSGIGEAVAMWHADHGATAIGIMGRSEERLGKVASALRSKGVSDVTVGAMDVCDKAAVRSFVRSFDDAHPIDLLVVSAGGSVDSIANDLGIEGQRYYTAVTAGCKGNESFKPESMESTGDAVDDVECAMANTNIVGMLHACNAVIARMVPRKHGTIAIVSSISACYPASGIYASTKVADDVIGRSWRRALAKHGIHVHVVQPGWVKTPMADAYHNSTGGDTPLMVDAKTAAELIAEGIANDDSVIRFPFLVAQIASPQRAIPVDLYDVCADWIPGL